MPLTLKSRYNMNKASSLMVQMSIILQILSLLFVVLWTARLARNKGRNPLVWGGVAAIPAVGLLEMFPEWITVLCMLPMLALVFMPARRPVATDSGQDGMTPCPRCQHSHEPGPTYCTNCGWELTRAYASADAAATTTEGAESPTAPTAPRVAGIADSPDVRVSASDATGVEPTAEPVMASQQVDEAEAATAPVETEAAPAFSMAPLSITRPLTAAGMTDLGLSLFNQGRVREAVDQFTKAIALDPRYREAWANRAKAYSELGLSEKAAADRQQLEAI